MGGATPTPRFGVVVVGKPAVEWTPPEPAEKHDHGQNFDKLQLDSDCLHKLVQLCERMETSIAGMEALSSARSSARSEHIFQNGDVQQLPTATLSKAGSVEDKLARKSEIGRKSVNGRKSSLGRKSKLVRGSKSASKDGTEFEDRVERIRERLDQDFSMKWDGRRGSVSEPLGVGLTSSLSSSFKMVTPEKSSFDIWCGLVIISYVAFLGLETELLSRGLIGYANAFFVIHMVYNIYFFLELLARLRLFGLVSFFRGMDARWNLLDVALVLSAVLDIAMGKTGTVSARLLRSIRVARIVRTVRIFRTLTNVREFQKMVFAITSSFKTLACSVIILFFILFFFSVIFAYGALEARDHYDRTSTPNPKAEDLQRYWGTFFTAIYSCFISVSTGQSWYVVLDPLSNYSGYLTFCFIGFIALTLFGVLNAITAIFVESAMMSAQHYKEMIILDTQHKKEMSVKHIRNVFAQIDEDGSGEISCAEMEFFFSHDFLRNYMEALDIGADDTRMLFRLLDRDGSGQIDVEEFCEGCLKLKGEARAFDMHVLLLQIRQFMEKWSDFTVYVRDLLCAMDAHSNAFFSESSGLSDIYARESICSFQSDVSAVNVIPSDREGFRPHRSV